MTIVKPSYPRLQHSHQLADGLLLALPFYEGGGLQVNDLSGRNNHSTLVNGPTWNAGRAGWSLNFDGVDDAVSFPAVTFSGPFSVCVWSRITNSAALRTIIGHDTFGDRIGYGQVAGKVLIRLSNTNDNTIDHPATGSWGFYCLTRDTANKIDLSIDGRPFNRLYANATMAGLMGFNGLSNIQRHHGQIDDVRIYNRALSTAEVAAIYHDPWRAYRPAKKISVLAVAPVKPSVEVTPQHAVAIGNVSGPTTILGSIEITAIVSAIASTSITVVGSVIEANAVLFENVHLVTSSTNVRLLIPSTNAKIAIPQTLATLVYMP